MKCHHHPNAPAVAQCEHCKTPICGICSRYVGDVVLCERCDEADARAKFVDTQARGKPGRMGDLIQEYEGKARQEPATQSKDRSPGKKEKIQMAVVIVCSIFIAARIMFSLGSDRVLTPAQIQAEEQRRSQIEDCMLVFWEIAEQLGNGRTPDNRAVCPGSSDPLMVAGSGNDLIVRHPDPQSLGLSDLYVTRANPTPVLVE